VPAQQPALHLHGSIWIASYPSCGYQHTTARTQERCKQRQPPTLPRSAQRTP